MNNGFNFFLHIWRTGTTEKQRENLCRKREKYNGEIIFNGRIGTGIGLVACKIISSILLEVFKLRGKSQLLGKDIIAGIHAWVGGLFKMTFSRLFPFLTSQGLLIDLLGLLRVSARGSSVETLDRP